MKQVAYLLFYVCACVPECVCSIIDHRNTIIAMSKCHPKACTYSDAIDQNK